MATWMAVLPVLWGPMWTSRAPGGSNRLLDDISVNSLGQEGGPTTRLTLPNGDPAPERAARWPPGGSETMPGMSSNPVRTRNVAVLLAGGVGARIGLAIPKQLIKVAGKTLLEHSLIALHHHPKVDEVLIMMAPGHLDAVRAIVKAGDYAKVTRILEGGETRNETTLRALDALGDEECHVLFHDAVRPLVSARIIEECFEALEHYPAVDVAIPSADTIIEVRDDNTIREIPPRAAFVAARRPRPSAPR